MRPQATLTVLPVERPLVGRVSPPGSKSITNRALLLAGLARGTSRLTGALKSDDTRVMSEALRLMGVQVDEPDDSTFVVTSSGHWQAPQQALFLGNAGTATRFLTAALANFEGDFVVDGDEYMRKRPIGPLVDALQRMGVEVSAPS
ncbi:3-phosphoshikimate 1-carboxyvinyltransferase, partial [Pseudomonas syringae pv. syringae FF5]